MSALVERVAEPRARVKSIARVEHESGLVAIRVLLTALYTAYVAIQLPSLLVPLAALLCGLAAVLMFSSEQARPSRAGRPASDASRRVAWCAAAAVVIAVLHARALPGDARWLVIQLGLAAFVVASATLSLLIVPDGVKVRLGVVLAIAAGLGGLVGAPAGAASGMAGAIAGLLAGMRPLSALEVVALGRTNDRWLAWTVVEGGR